MEQDVVAADVRRLRVKPHVAAMVSDFTVGRALGMKWLIFFLFGYLEK